MINTIQSEARRYQNIVIVSIELGFTDLEFKSRRNRSWNAFGFDLGSNFELRSRNLGSGRSLVKPTLSEFELSLYPLKKQKQQLRWEFENWYWYFESKQTNNTPTTVQIFVKFYLWIWLMFFHYLFKFYNLFLSIKTIKRFTSFYRKKIQFLKE